MRAILALLLWSASASSQAIDQLDVQPVFASERCLTSSLPPVMPPCAFMMSMMRMVTGGCGGGCTADVCPVRQ